MFLRLSFDFSLFSKLKRNPEIGARAPILFFVIKHKPKKEKP